MLGLGRSGLATARALAAGEATPVCWDDNEPAQQAAADEGFEIAEIARPREAETLDALIVSPGIPHLYPEPHRAVVLAQENAIPVDNDVGLFFRALLNHEPDDGPDPKVIAVTGSNGKSTTTALIHHLLDTAGGPAQDAPGRGLPHRHRGGQRGRQPDRGRGRGQLPQYPDQLRPSGPAVARAVATRQLATLTGAGIPLVEAMGALVQQIEHPYLKAVMAQVRDRVNEGSSLADALQDSGEFDNLYVSMIRAGEASGTLEPVLMRIADYLEEQVRLAGKISSILMYPAFMLAFTALVVVVLVTFVLPQITSLLADLEQELPSTRAG